MKKIILSLAIVFSLSAFAQKKSKNNYDKVDVVIQLKDGRMVIKYKDKKGKQKIDTIPANQSINIKYANELIQK